MRRAARARRRSRRRTRPQARPRDVRAVCSHPARPGSDARARAGRPTPLRRAGTRGRSGRSPRRRVRGSRGRTRPRAPRYRTQARAPIAARTGDSHRARVRRHPRAGLRAPAEASCRYARNDVLRPASCRGRRAAGLVRLRPLHRSGLGRDRGRLRARAAVLQRVPPGYRLVARHGGRRGRVAVSAATPF